MLLAGAAIKVGRDGRMCVCEIYETLMRDPLGGRWRCKCWLLVLATASGCAYIDIRHFVAKRRQLFKSFSLEEFNTEASPTSGKYEIS